MQLWVKRTRNSTIGLLIGTLRCELLDHVFLWSTGELKRKLEGFRQCCNVHCTRISLNGDTPSETAGEAIGHCANLNQYKWKSHCRGLYQLPVAT